MAASPLKIDPPRKIRDPDEISGKSVTKKFVAGTSRVRFVYFWRMPARHGKTRLAARFEQG